MELFAGIAAIVAAVGGIWVLVFGRDTIGQRIKKGRDWLTRRDRSPKSPAVTEYLQCLLRDVATVDYRGFGSAYRHRLHVKLAKVFIPLNSSTPKGHRLTPSPYTGLYMRKDEERIPLLRSIADSQRSIVLGRAGAGKTTLVRYLALSVAEAHLFGEISEEAGEMAFETGSLPVPIYIPLRDFALQVRHALEHEEAAPDFSAALGESLSSLVPETAGEDLLEALLNGSNPCLFLFDGLDETGPPAVRTLLRERLERWINDHPRHRYVITARPESYVGASALDGQFRTWEIADFSYEDIVAYVHAWYGEVFADEESHPDDPVHEADDLLQAMNRMDDVMELASTPLLLTAIVLIHLTRGVLPDRRCEVFELCTRALLGEWDMSKQGTGSKTSLMFWEEEQQSATSRRTHLEYIAYHLVEKQKTSANADELAEILVREAPHFKPQAEKPEAVQKERAMEFLASLAARGGVLEELQEARYAFTHPSFRAYLAARRLGRHDNLVDVVRLRASDPEWREVIRLACGHISQRDPERATAILELLVDSAFPGDQGEKLGLAALCLLDADRPTLGEDIVGGIVKMAAAAMLQDSLAPRVRAQLGWTIGWLGDPRSLDMFVDVPEGEVAIGSDEHVHERPHHKVRVKPFSIGAYPVTNAEYDRFVRSRGYEESRWWTEAGWSWRSAAKVDQPFYWKHPDFRVPNHPVVGVSWFEAMAFAKWAGGRLPCEPEWEGIARGEDRYPWPWGEEFRASLCNTAELGLQGTTPVGMFGPLGPYGVNDMAGNIWEWMGSLHAPYPYDPADGREDPEASGSRVLRGGSWYGTAADARCSARRWLHPSTRMFNFGFRVVRNVDPRGANA